MPIRRTTVEKWRIGVATWLLLPTTRVAQFGAFWGPDSSALRFASRLGLLLAMVVSLSYCGGGDGDGDKSDGRAGAPMIEMGAIPCGRNICKLPGEVTGPGLRACCIDAFSGACGVTTRKRDDCREYPTIDTRCPVSNDIQLDLWFGDGSGSGKTFGCCTSDNQCGFDVVGDYDDYPPVLAGLPGFGFEEQEGATADLQRCIPGATLLCDLASAELLAKEQIDARTCDGQPQPLPDGCGDPWMFPPFPP